MDLEALDDALCCGDLASLKEVQSRMTVCRSEKPFNCGQVKETTVLCAAVFTDSNDNEVMAVGMEGGLGLLSGDCSYLTTFLPLDYHLPSGEGAVSPASLLATRVRRDRLLCLDDMGAVHVICPRMLVATNVWTREKVLDMVLIEDEGDLQKLSLLMTVSKLDGSHALQMREFPSFRLMYELEVGRGVFCSLRRSL